MLRTAPAYIRSVNIDNLSYTDMEKYKMINKIIHIALIQPLVSNFSVGLARECMPRRETDIYSRSYNNIALEIFSFQSWIINWINIKHERWRHPFLHYNQIRVCRKKTMTINATRNAIHILSNVNFSPVTPLTLGLCLISIFIKAWHLHCTPFDPRQFNISCPYSVPIFFYFIKNFGFVRVAK